MSSATAPRATRPRTRWWIGAQMTARAIASSAQKPRKRHGGQSRRRSRDTAYPSSGEVLLPRARVVPLTRAGWLSKAFSSGTADPPSLLFSVSRHYLSWPWCPWTMGSRCSSCCCLPRPCRPHRHCDHPPCYRRRRLHCLSHRPRHRHPRRHRRPNRLHHRCRRLKPCPSFACAWRGFPCACFQEETRRRTPAGACLRL